MRVAKDELRREMRDRRAAMPRPEAAECARRASARLLSLPEVQSARRVALYAPVRGELDTSAIAAALRARGVVVAYPRVVADQPRLEFRAVADDATLVPGVLTIPEPTDVHPVVPLADLDAVVVPGLAFDPTGHRLGWGRGYFDATLAAAPRALRVGYAYEFQIVPAVPATADDERMHVICTDHTVRRVR